MSILTKIVLDTRSEILRRKLVTPVARLMAMPGYDAPTLKLARALKKPDLTVIAEVKKASPSKGIIRKDFRPADHALDYKMGGAAAISVLTEPLHFQGSLQYLADVRQVVDLPVLRKDFIVDEYQLHEARACGADAVLLIAAVLERSELYDLHQIADELGLSCLVEVYEEKELEKIDFDQISVLGVNNRNLHTFEVDLDHSLRVFSRAPETVVKVAESGLRNAADLAYLRRNGVDAVLIGESLMRERNPGEALETLLDDTENLLTFDPGLRLVG